MKYDMRASVIACTALAVTALLTGCVGEQQRPLYYWGDYQERVYHYFKTPGESPQAELAKLSETQQIAASKNAALPPGFNAHLGLLYLKSGQGEKARSAFMTEEAQFPESKPYMDFLLKKKGPAAIAAPATKSVPAKPAASTTPMPAKAPASPAPAVPKTTGDAK